MTSRRSDIITALACAALAVAGAVILVRDAGASQLYRPGEAPPMELRDRQDALLRLYVRTRACMRSAGEAAFRRRGAVPGFDQEFVQHFMVSVCGDPLRVQLQNDGMPEPIARAILVRLSRTSYYEDVLRTEEPPATR